MLVTAHRHRGKDFSGSPSCTSPFSWGPRTSRQNDQVKTYFESPLGQMSGPLSLSFSSRANEHNILVILIPSPFYFLGGGGGGERV